MSAPVSRAQSATSVPPGGSWEVSASPFALHWHDDDEHRHVYQLGLELHEADQSLRGVSIFRNSFGQASGYVYYGHEWDDLLGHPALYAKLTGGLMYGYRGQFKNKVPLNYGGFSPAVVPAIGFRITPADAVQADILGLAGLLFSYTRRF